MTGKRTNEPAVLVSWVSVNHRAAPLLSAIDGSESPFRGRFQRIYLCWREVGTEDGEREKTAVRQTLKELRSALEPVCPEIVKVPWKTDAAPTDHTAIRPFAEQILQRARQENPNAEVVIHLSPGTPAMHAVWLVLGTTGFLEGKTKLIQTADERGRDAGRPEVQEVQLDLDTWLKRFRASQPRLAGQDDDGQLWDPAMLRSRPLREALQRLQQWAPLRVPVLLVGERGTGKTTMAHFLRSMSPYQQKGTKGWPVVVCGQFRVNPQLARSELFGHKKGAFTGATSDRKGLLEEADGDTLFLDEIADIDGDTQRLLMAAVEGRGFQRLGDSQTRHSAFRLVSATNRPLATLRDEVLDRDFYDRVATLILEVPPLRRCSDDLPLFWRRVLQRATVVSGIAPDGWNQYAEHTGLLRHFGDHPLPGNFRDLQRAAYHLLAALHADRPESEVISAAVESLEEARLVSSSPSLDAPSESLPLAGGLKKWLEEREREWLEMAMREAGNNKSGAARLLGLPRKTFEHRWRNTSERK